MRHAARAAERLATSGARAILSSDAVRAAQTAEVIGARLGLTPRFTSALRERHWGILQGRTDESAWNSPHELTAGERLEKGESLADVALRVRYFLEGLRRSNGPLIVVTHGDTMGVAMRMLLGLPLDAPPHHGVANGEVVSQLLHHDRHEGSGLQVLPLGDAPHVDAINRPTRPAAGPS
jgi:probable phosphoglycerate mutase